MSPERTRSSQEIWDSLEIEDQSKFWGRLSLAGTMGGYQQNFGVTLKRSGGEWADRGGFKALRESALSLVSELYGQGGQRIAEAVSAGNLSLHPDSLITLREGVWIGENDWPRLVSNWLTDFRLEMARIPPPDLRRKKPKSRFAFTITAREEEPRIKTYKSRLRVWPSGASVTPFDIGFGSDYWPPRLEVTVKGTYSQWQRGGVGIRLQRQKAVEALIGEGKGQDFFLSPLRELALQMEMIPGTYGVRLTLLGQENRYAFVRPKTFGPKVWGADLHGLCLKDLLLASG